MNDHKKQLPKVTNAYVNNLAAIGAKYASIRNERERDMMKAKQFYLQAAQYGHTGANYELGLMYHFGVPGIVRPSLSRATKYYEVAAANGMAAAKYNLGLLWEDHNEDKAMALWLEAANLGHLKSMCCVAIRYFQGIGVDEETGKIMGNVPQNFDRALYYWGLAAEQDCPKAIHSLSLMYEYGIGVEKNTIRADELRDLAAFCWTQQNQPFPGQTGLKGRPDQLPDWLTKPNGQFPNWRRRNFIASKRPPPNLLSKKSTGHGPSMLKQHINSTTGADLSLSPPSMNHSYATSPDPTIPLFTQSPNSTALMSSPHGRPPSSPPPCLLTNSSPSSSSSELMKSAFIIRIETLTSDSKNDNNNANNNDDKQLENQRLVKPFLKPSLFSLNFKDRDELLHRKLTKPPSSPQASPPPLSSIKKTLPSIGLAMADSSSNTNHQHLQNQTTVSTHPQLSNPNQKSYLISEPGTSIC